MALYEVGNCFFHGWGLPHPDYPMAVSYFKLAAESGDRDAQERELTPSRAGLDSWATRADFDCRSRARLDTLAGQTGSQEEYVSPPFSSRGRRLDQCTTGFRHEAAKWYRTAISQGASGVGLSWVYKVRSGTAG